VMGLTLSFSAASVGVKTVTISLLGFARSYCNNYELADGGVCQQSLGDAFKESVTPALFSCFGANRSFLARECRTPKFTFNYLSYFQI